MSQDAAHFAVVFNNLLVAHRSDLGRSADEALYQSEIPVFETFARQEVDLVQAAGVAIAESTRECSVLAANALGAPTTVRLILGLFMRVHAAHAVLDQMAAPGVTNQIDNFGLG